LERTANSTNVGLLMKALTSTKKFEKDFFLYLHKEYDVYIKYALSKRDFKINKKKQLINNSREESKEVDSIEQ
jgi:hypothetical protein